MLVYSFSLFLHESQKTKINLDEKLLTSRLNELEKQIDSFRVLTPATVVALQKSEGLEAFKEIGGTGTYMNPITQRQEVMAFAQSFNSSRYEVNFISSSFYLFDYYCCYSNRCFEHCY